MKASAKINMRTQGWIGIFLFETICLLSTQAGTLCTATTSGNWTNTATWGGYQVPDDGDSVVISNGVTVILDQPSKGLSDVTNYGTIAFTNWAAQLTVSNAIIYGNLTHSVNTATVTNTAGQWVPDGRVYVVCTNFTLMGNATINVTGKGYQGGTNTATVRQGYGPGAGWGSNNGRGGGGSYGGVGGQGSMAVPIVAPTAQPTPQLNRAAEVRQETA